jgi:hypothetical protein
MERFTNAAFSFEVTDTAAAGGDGPEGVAILLHGFPQHRRLQRAGCRFRHALPVMVKACAAALP